MQEGAGAGQDGAAVPVGMPVGMPGRMPGRDPSRPVQNDRDRAVMQTGFHPCTHGAPRGRDVLSGQRRSGVGQPRGTVAGRDERVTGASAVSGVFGPVRACRGIALAGLVALICTLPARAEPHRLAPGDKIRAQIIRLGQPAYVGTVDTVGDIRLPHLGTYRAAGKTLDELISDIVLAVAGRQIVMNTGTADAVIVLNESDVFLDIDSYRPVTVTGMVATPGRVSFEPGLTARAAVGIAGGTGHPGLRAMRSDRVESLRTRIEEVEQTEAWLLADLWRLDMLLGEADPQAPPEAHAPVLTARLDDAALEMQRVLAAGLLEERQLDRDDIGARIALSEAQISFLEAALEQFKAASENEEARLRDILTLADRGLTTANVVDTARTGALNASSRVLTTQADLAGTERGLQDLRRALHALDAEFRTRTLEEKTRTRQALAERRARLEGLREELALSGIAREAAAEPGPSYRFMLYRREAGEERRREIDLGEALRPGDVIEVLLTGL